MSGTACAPLTDTEASACSISNADPKRWLFSFWVAREITAPRGDASTRGSCGGAVVSSCIIATCIGPSPANTQRPLDISLINKPTAYRSARPSSGSSSTCGRHVRGVPSESVLRDVLWVPSLGAAASQSEHLPNPARPRSAEEPLSGLSPMDDARAWASASAFRI